jgi:hypothetical protein
MKPLGALLVTGFLALAFVTHVEASDQSKKELKKGGTLGVVEKIDSDSKTLTLRTGKKKKDPDPQTLKLSFSDETKFYSQTPEGTKEVKLADVKAGQQAVVAHEKKEGKDTATKVTFIEKKKKKNK